MAPIFFSLLLFFLSSTIRATGRCDPLASNTILLHSLRSEAISRQFLVPIIFRHPSNLSVHLFRGLLFFSYSFNSRCYYFAAFLRYTSFQYAHPILVRATSSILHCLPLLLYPAPPYSLQRQSIYKNLASNQKFINYLLSAHFLFAQSINQANSVSVRWSPSTRNTLQLQLARLPKYDGDPYKRGMTPDLAITESESKSFWIWNVQQNMLQDEEIQQLA